MEVSSMTPKRPYLLRAFYEWIVDNELTPFLVVDATKKGVRVPQGFVENGQIILNVAPQSTGNFNIMSDEAVTFNARFSGRPHSIILPMSSIQAIYAKENGVGTMFEPEEIYESEDPDEEFLTSVESLKNHLDSDSSNESSRTRRRPALRVIK